MSKSTHFRPYGYYYDEDTGLYYLQSRYYNPEIGRFINADAVENLGASGTTIGYNLFAYCENNPIMGYDLEGTVNWKGFWCGVGITAIGAGIIVAMVLSGGAALGVGAGIAAGVIVSGTVGFSLPTNQKVTVGMDYYVQITCWEWR